MRPRVGQGRPQNFGRQLMLWKRLLIVVACISFMWGAVPAHAKRIAFVSGIDDYKNLTSLSKAVNDAEAMEKALRGLGFDIVAGFDLKRREFNSKFDEFIQQIEPGDTVAFFFSGHGLQINGLNYLLPSDEPDPDHGEEVVRSWAISFNDLMDRVERRKPQISIYILDACRDNPFQSGGKRTTNARRGLADLQQVSRGSFIMYSAGSNEQALDWLVEGEQAKNSVYTRRLLPLLVRPDLSLVEIAKKVQVEVAQDALTNHFIRGRHVRHSQRPAYYDNIVGDFYLAKPPPPPVPAVVPEPKPASRPVRACNGVRASVANETACLKPLDEFRDCASCPQMVVVAPGKFVMGANDGSTSERPPHEVTIANSFAIGKFEITFDEWEECLKERGCTHLPDDWKWGKGRRPVISVSWLDVVEQYLPWLARRTNALYRLPTEAEWEYVARAGSTSKYFFGEDASRLCNFGNISDVAFINKYGSGRYVPCSDGFADMAPVGQFAPSSFGVFDTIGNASEWVQECWHSDYVRAPVDGSEWTEGGDCEMRVVRGGSFRGLSHGVRSAQRYFAQKGTRERDIGFRVVRDLVRR